MGNDLVDQSALQGNAVASLTINGKVFDTDVEPDTPPLWAIQENAGLTGTKYGCGIAHCGAHTIHIDGVALLRQASASARCP